MLITHVLIEMKALKILIFVICLGLVSSGLLVALSNHTAPIIAKNEELKLKASVLDALDISYTKDTIEQAFADNVELLNSQGLDFYRYADRAVAFKFHGSGLWGPISGIISLSTDLKTIVKIKILHQEETPGLGGRITEDWFLDQFRGKKITPFLIFKPEGKAVGFNEVDGITGATGTSKALEKLLNESLKKHIAALR